MNSEQVRAEERIHHPAYELAVAITRQSWLDAGMTPEELEHDAQIAEAFERWIQAGCAPEDFIAPEDPTRLLTRFFFQRQPDGDQEAPVTQTANTRRLALSLGLSEEEAEVAIVAAMDYSNVEIAELLKIGLPTVKYHLYRTYQKLGVRRRSQLAHALRVPSSDGELK